MSQFAQAFQFTPDALALVGKARLAYVRKVYSYFTAGILAAIGGSILAMNSSLVFIAAQHRIILFIVYIGAFFLAQSSADKPARAVPTMILFTFISGVVLSPLLYAIAHSLIPGTGPGVIYNALILTGTVFAGLTAYVFVTKKDFSYLGATLTVGLFVIMGAILLNIFMHSSSLDFAISIVGTIIFAGFVLVDTSLILKRAIEIPPTSAALKLYLDFLNLFLFILRILMGSRSRD
ncbi:MAG: Bax inhibitor-1/YccA family protein [Bacteroidetes bacterium]|nr:Bax inhibitor-1/YccA family protein [Bacteroidota bacterium]